MLGKIHENGDRPKNRAEVEWSASAIAMKIKRDLQNPKN